MGACQLSNKITSNNNNRQDKIKDSDKQTKSCGLPDSKAGSRYCFDNVRIPETITDNDSTTILHFQDYLSV